MNSFSTAESEKQFVDFFLFFLHLLFLIVLEHTVGVEHGGVLHLFNIGAWLRSLGHKIKVKTSAFTARLRLNQFGSQKYLLSYRVRIKGCVNIKCEATTKESKLCIKNGSRGKLGSGVDAKISKANCCSYPNIYPTNIEVI